MNKLQHWIQDKITTSAGFLRDTDLPELIAMDRLCPVLVRTNMGRFTTAAQCVAHYVALVDQSGQDYVRDISMPAGSVDRAAGWHPAGPRTAARPPVGGRRHILSPDERDYGGVFDGTQVISDTELDGGAPGF